MKQKILAVLLVALSFLLVSCADTPEGAARAWLNAMMKLDGNKILDLTCATQVENVQQSGLWESAFALVPQLFGLNVQSKSDISGLNFVTTSLNGDNATVHVYGNMRVAVLAYAQAYPVDELWQMAMESGKWKWCGEATP